MIARLRAEWLSLGAALAALAVAAVLLVTPVRTGFGLRFTVVPDGWSPEVATTVTCPTAPRLTDRPFGDAAQHACRRARAFRTQRAAQVAFAGGAVALVLAVIAGIARPVGRDRRFRLVRSAGALSGAAAVVGGLVLGVIGLAGSRNNPAPTPLTPSTEALVDPAGALFVMDVWAARPARNQQVPPGTARYLLVAGTTDELDRRLRAAGVPTRDGDEVEVGAWYDRWSPVAVVGDPATFVSSRPRGWDGEDIRAVIADVTGHIDVAPVVLVVLTST